MSGGTRRFALIAFLALASHAGSASAAVTLPDLEVLVPTDLISVGTDPTTGHRDLRFTHITADVGRGPFEIDPHYNPRTGTSTFRQAIYASTRPGVWRLDHRVAIRATGVWRPPSDYAFPLTRFTLNRPAAGGTPGAVVATSPKRDYCITGDYRLTGIPNTPDQTAIPASNCQDPTAPLGWSVGWGDEYDQTDAGQPIDLTGVRDGTYVLHAVVDPTRAVLQSSTGNDVTDTLLRITGGTVTVLSQRTRAAGPSRPPRRGLSVGFLNPGPSDLVSGAVNVAAAVSGAAGRAWVRFRVDGRDVGPRLSRPPFAVRWDTRRVHPGRHRLTVRVIDTAGHHASAVVVVTVRNPPPPMTCFVLQAHTRAQGRGAVTTGSVHTASRDETLLAFVSADGPAGAAQSGTVTGGGLSWHRVTIANGVAGDAEIWTAYARGVLRDARVRVHLSVTGYGALLSVVALEGAGGVGARAAASAESGPPRLELRTRGAASLVFAVGHDWDHAIGRVLAPGWVRLDQWLDPGAGDTAWSQYTNATTGPAGARVTVADAAPVADAFNLAAVEVRGEG